MTVKELIGVLEQCPKSAPIVISRDSEGNGFYDVYEVARLLGFKDDTTFCIFPNDIEIN